MNRLPRSFSLPLVPLLAVALLSCSDEVPTEPLPTADPPAIPSFAVSSNNGQIAFQSNRDGNLEIYVMNPDGTNQTNLTNRAIGRQYDPAWSPDGTQIALTHNPDLAGGYEDVYVMRADGGDLRNLTNTPSLWEYRPTWSPDGDQIAFEAVDANIWIMNADGTGKTNLTESLPHLSREPDWSPDGRQILFTGYDVGRLGSEILVIDTDGTGVTNLTAGFDGFSDQGDWSPDGKEIAFLGHSEGVFGIFVMNANGTGIRNLTNYYEGDGESFDPSWSPDGTRIAFASHRDGNWEIYTMNPDGSDQTRLTNNPAADRKPSWQYQPRNAAEVEINIVSFDDVNRNGTFDTGEDREGSYILIEAESGSVVDDCVTPCQVLVPPTQGYYVWQLQEPNWDLLSIGLDGAPAELVERPPDEVETRPFVGTPLVVGLEDDPHTVVFQNVQRVRVAQIEALLEDAWVQLLIGDMTDSGRIERELETTLNWLQREPPRLNKVAGSLDDLEAEIADGDPADAVHLAYLQLVVDRCQQLLAQLMGA